MRKTQNQNEEPVYLFLSGRAGCGKSFAVKCVKKFIQQHCPPGFLKIAAPTGTAAFLIKGDTLHSSLKLPVNTAYNNDLNDLPNLILKSLQDAFVNTQILMIDEMSMVGKYMLYQISKRLQEAKPQNSTLPFAGVSIVLMGDFAQLPPVTDHPLFEEKAGTKYQLFGRHLYSSLFKVNFTLTQSLR